MNPDRYLKIDELVGAALEVAPAERASFLEKTCEGDLALRAEVESLIDACLEAGDFIETPAIEVAARSLAEDSILSLAGKSVGRYQIVSLLGEGGMGEVYLALDKQMNRKVALKILPAQFTQSPDRVARFQREARAASALNHPNIITIYEIGHEHGVNFIASELVEGETLRRRVNRGKLGVKETIEIAMQIASALSAAHAAGIIHRDIKPENLMVRRDGYVKVLDFGLAKLTEPGDSDPNQSILSNSTQAGTVLGTINYMSPEQARGLEIDSRTDLFSLGVVFYEMVTGHQPFKGATAASTFDAILNNPPAPIASAIPDVSTELVRITNRALEKDREVRYQTASDFRAELRSMQKTLDSQATASADAVLIPTSPRNGKYVSDWWMKAALASSLLAILIALAWLFLPRGSVRIDGVNWKKAVARKITDQQGAELFPSLSPDGKSVVYASRATGTDEIYLKRIGSRKTSNLTEGSSAQNTQPALSHDGKRIAFRRTNGAIGGIFVMSETGESVRQLTDFGYNPAWARDGKQIACTENSVQGSERGLIPSRLWVVNSTTGESRQLPVTDAVQASWSPTGQRIAYWGVREGAQRDIWTINVTGGEPVPVTDDSFVDWNPVWSADGRYLYFISNRSGAMNLWRVIIDEATGVVSGEPELVPSPSSNTGLITLSGDGRHLAYVQASYTQNIERLSFDPAGGKVLGNRNQVTKSSGELTSPSISPDGKVIACQSAGEQIDLFSFTIGNPVLNQLTEDETNEMSPRWSPDGKHLAFYSNKNGAYQIYLINPDGSGARQITEAKPPGVVLPVWSPDGGRLAYSLFGGKTLIIDLNRPWKDQKPVETHFLTSDPDHFVASSWSSDGKYLAGSGYSINRAVGLFAYSLETQASEMVSSFGSIPQWLSDSRRLLFVLDDKLFLTDLLSKKPREIFSFAPDKLVGLDISKDNRSVYLSVASTEADIWLLTLE